MDYIEVDFTVNPIIPYNEILIAELSELGFESFIETPQGILAYIPNDLFKKEAVVHLISLLENTSCKINFNEKLIPAQNWNERWENEFSPIVVADTCLVRAPFHPPVSGISYDIIIEPKMAFGTGHHETTGLMIEFVLHLNIAGKNVLDMGCGTCILGILASKMGAKHVLAIDTDEWAYKNATENVNINACKNINVRQGDASLLKGKKFEVILANINRNVLLEDMPHYEASLETNGVLLISGFFDADIDILKVEAESLKLNAVHHQIKNHWAAMEFRKIF